MAIRTTAAAVRKIVKAKASVDLTPFIEAANQLVDDCCSEAGYDSVKERRIETWLAAHFYLVFKPNDLIQIAGTAQHTIESRVDLRLQVTRHGQQALLLDTAGGLAALNNSAGVIIAAVKPRFFYIGGGRK